LKKENHHSKNQGNPQWETKKNKKIDATVTTFEFPIGVIRGKAPMKNIPLSTIPSFQGMTIEDPHTFLLNLMSCGGAIIILWMLKS